MKFLVLLFLVLVLGYSVVLIVSNTDETSLNLLFTQLPAFNTTVMMLVLFLAGLTLGILVSVFLFRVIGTRLQNRKLRKQLAKEQKEHAKAIEEHKKEVAQLTKEAELKLQKAVEAVEKQAKAEAKEAAKQAKLAVKEAKKAAKK